MAERSLLITGVGGETTVNTLVAVPVGTPVRRARSVTVNVPFRVGEPEIRPLVRLTLRPWGSPAASKAVGDPLAVIV